MLLLIVKYTVLMILVEAQRQVSDYKFKLKKAEQDITQLEGNVSIV